MPASTVDVIDAALKASFGGKSEDGVSLDSQLAGSSRKALLGDIEFEPAENYQSLVLDVLKSKYIVLKGQEQLNNKCSEPEQKPTTPDDILPPAAKELFPMERVQLGWSNTTDWSVGAGMVNMGNTCYLNSTLQALFHVPSLVNWLISDKDQPEEWQDGGASIICAMRRTLQESQQRNVTSIRPILIYNKLRLVCKNLIPGRQEDAHEFLRHLVEAMEKSYLKRFKNYQQFDSKIKETTPLNQILGGYLRSAVRCLRCGHVSTTFQHFQDLPLDIRKAQTLDEALELYFSREKLDDESYHCEACQKKVQATKQFSLERPPMVLCIQLKRFSVSNNKMTKHVSFRQRLDMSRYARQKTNAPLIYRLVAMVSHMGPTVNCGHYTAVAQSPSGNFYQFDDSMVRSISHQTVFNTNAYIMLYEVESAPQLHKSALQHPLKSKASSTITEPPPPAATATTTTTESTNKSPLKSSNCNAIKSAQEAAKIGPQLPLGIGFTSDKVYGPELPPERVNGEVSSSLGNAKGKVGSTSSLSPELTDESGTESSEEEESKKSPSSPPIKEADSSTANDDSPKATSGGGGRQASPDVSPCSSSNVSTSISSLSSPETPVSTKKLTVNGNSSSPSKSLVPYETGDTSGSEDSNHSESNNRVGTKATLGEWQVTSSTDVTPLNGTPTKATTTVGNNQWADHKQHIDTPSGNVVSELFKMSTSGYSAPVSTWNGTRSQLDKEVHQERREDRKRSLAADSSADQGRIKHTKVTSSYGGRGGKSNPGYNPVQEYHNMKNWSNGNNGCPPNGNGYHHKPYYHGNNNNRHKRNNYHHGNKGGGGNGGFHNNKNNGYRYR